MASLINLGEIKKQDPKTQCLVFGFVRRAQRLLSDETSFWNITELIIYTIMAFYQSVEFFEYFDKDCVKLSDDKMTITKIGRVTWITAYGSQIIKYDSSGVHRWRLKINRISSDIQCIVGIDESNHLSFNKYFCSTPDHLYYGYSGWGNEFDQTGWRSYKTKYKNGDIVQVELDMNDKLMTFYINDKKIKPIGVRKTDIGYSLAVSFLYNDDNVTLLSYNYHSK